MREFFRKFARSTADLLGGAESFLMALFAIVVWAALGPVYHYSDTWQLVINTATTIVTFLMVFLIQNFRGPGTYTSADVEVQMHNPDNSVVWMNRVPDKVTFTIERGQQTGTVDAQMTNSTSAKSGAEHVTGRWNCRG